MLVYKHRSSSWQMCFKRSVFENFAKFTGKFLCWSLFLIKLYKPEGLQLYQKETPTQVFSVNIARFLRTVFFIVFYSGCFYNQSRKRDVALFPEIIAIQHLKKTSICLRKS